MSGLPGSVSVLPPEVTLNCVEPSEMEDILTVQLSCRPAEVPVQLAVYVFDPCITRTLVAQLAATLLHGRFTPVI